MAWSVAWRRLAAVVGIVGGAALLAPPLHAQPRCAFLCAPDVKIEPTVTVEHLFGAARMEQLEGGEVVATGRQERESVFELILAVGIP
ncbi:MAG TPA: hypothetical protein DEQ98_07895, partial [Acidobacteria bacterium]|nr:hypothetical protein [Acidobacteriota bacterium]